MRLFLSVLTLIAFSSTAWAQGAPAPAAEPAAKPANLETMVVCERSDPPLGSRIGGTKVCHTVAQWREIHNNSQNFMTSIQTGRATNTGVGMAGGGH